MVIKHRRIQINQESNTRKMEMKNKIKFVFRVARREAIGRIWKGDAKYKISEDMR